MRTGAPGSGRRGQPHTAVGRAAELAAAEGLLDDPDVAVELVGEAGIGKTVIWREVLERARARGWRVLSAAPSAAEVQLSFGALGDLVASVTPDELSALATPQRRALEVALLRADGPPVDHRGVAVALLALIRVLAGRSPVVIAVDDLPSLDAPTAGALGFVLRRLDNAGVSVLATRRSDQDEAGALHLEQALGPERVRRLPVGPLALEATGELLAARLNSEVPNSVLVALYDAAAGNPFVTLELARELERRGIVPAPGMPLPIPASVRNLVSARLERLPAEVRRLLLAAAALTRPTVELLTRVRPDADACLERAADAGVIEWGPDGAIEFTQPLLAQVPYERLDPAQRRRLHAELAEVVDDAEERARHRALAEEAPSASTAAELEAAAAAAGARGAVESAAELCRLAARLTPPADRGQRWARLLAAAEWHHRGGELSPATTLVESLLSVSDAAPEIRARARALLATVRADTDGVAAALALYRAARRESGVSAATRAEIHRRCAWLALGAGDARGAERHGRAALRLAAGQDRVHEAGAIAVAVLTATVRGHRPRRDLLNRARALDDAATELRPGDWLETSPAVMEGVALLWAGELEEAREPLERVRALAAERDDPWLEMHSLAYLSALRTGLGEPRQGLELALRYLELATASGQPAQRAGALWPVAVAAAWLGDEARVRAVADEALAIAGASGHALYAIGCRAAVGMLELSAGRPAEAVAELERAREQAEGSGIQALARVPMLPDLVQALAAAGHGDRARAAAAILRERAGRLAAPWALALAERGKGIVAAADGDTDGAIVALERALAEHARQPRATDCARTELVLGGMLRRAGRKRAARHALERSARAFEAAGAELWAAQARRELGRIGGRSAPPAGELSATEASIADLVRAGRTNREIAAALHLSPRTVEWNLSRIYRKLGVRSRTELASALGKSGGFPG